MFFHCSVFRRSIFALAVLLWAGTSHPLQAAPPGEEMVLIPASSFIMGTGPLKGEEGETYGIDEEPGHPVDLKAFHIDRYEVTLGQYREFMKATSRTWIGEARLQDIYPPEILSDPKVLSEYPINLMGWDDANSYCQWKGKRLPTEEEWEKAARGTDGRRYPWGDRYQSNAANTRDLPVRHPVAVGSFPEDKSPYGLFDTAGNVAEWTGSRYLPYPGSRFSKDPRWEQKVYVVKGGSYHMPGELYSRPSSRSLAYPSYSHGMYGFRCAKDAPP